MTATLALSEAILKRRFPDGELPKAQHASFPFISMVSKSTDFDGDDKVVALQTENVQGSSADFATALGSLYQGQYSRFLLERVEHFTVARIKGQALKAAQKNTGALVDLWMNETDSASLTELKCLETYAFGNGSGTLGAATFSSTTATLSTISNIVYFDINMRVGAVSDATLSPTVRTGYARVTGIDRSAGTLTTGSAWTTQITGLTNGDYLCRAGDNASGGAGVVITGLQSWIAGGASPGTLFGLSRNTDPVRLAGQSYDASGVPMEDAVIEAEALVSVQGHMGGKTLWANPRDVANLKKSLSGKVTYQREKVSSSVAGVSFEAVQFEGDNGTIKIMTSPFCPRNMAFLVDMSYGSLDSLGPAPQMLDWDSNSFLRVASDDAYEVRIGLYGQLNWGRAPVKHIRITNFGA